MATIGRGEEAFFRALEDVSGPSLNPPSWSHIAPHVTVDI